MNRRILGIVIAVWMLMACVAMPAQADSILFEQLSWFGTGSSTPYSNWGRANLEYAGAPETLYFNLNVNGEWVVQNLALSSYDGPSATNTIATFFPLGSSAGTPVDVIEYGYSIDLLPAVLLPGLGDVADVLPLDYQIGGEEGVDLGTPPEKDPAGSTGGVVKSGELKDLDKVEPLPQGMNECAPGAIANSLQYLKRRTDGEYPQIDMEDLGIDDVKEWTGWQGSASGTSADWYRRKKDYLADKGITTRWIDAPLTEEEIDDLIAQLEDGQDIEVDLQGHVELLVGLKVFEDGRIQLDLIDDNQKDGDKADGIHSSFLQFVDGVPYVDGMRLERFVVECPVPEPGTMALLGLAGLGGLVARRRHAA